MTPPEQRRPLRGTVVLCVRFSTTGSVVSEKLISGPVRLRAMVLDSVKQWTFLPLWKNGRQVSGQGILRIHLAVVDGQLRSMIENEIHP
jgi:hypothetical protein